MGYRHLRSNQVKWSQITYTKLFRLAFILASGSKYKVELFTLGEYYKTKVKLTPLKEKTACFYALFSRSGFEDKVIAEAESNDNIQLYDLGQIVNYIE